MSILIPDYDFLKPGNLIGLIVPIACSSGLKKHIAGPLFISFYNWIFHVGYFTFIFCPSFIIGYSVLDIGYSSFDFRRVGSHGLQKIHHMISVMSFL
jgi:hypothetical protein